MMTHNRTICGPLAKIKYPKVRNQAQIKYNVVTMCANYLDMVFDTLSN